MCVYGTKEEETEAGMCVCVYSCVYVCMYGNGTKEEESEAGMCVCQWLSKNRMPRCRCNISQEDLD
jgi:hypothetical protein